MVALRYSTTTSASLRPKTWSARLASCWLGLDGGGKLSPDDSLPNTPLPQTAAKGTNRSVTTSASRLLRNKACPHASNMSASRASVDNSSKWCKLITSLTSHTVFTHVKGNNCQGDYRSRRFPGRVSIKSRRKL